MGSSLRFQLRLVSAHRPGEGAVRKERVLLLLWQALVAGASGRVARSTIGALQRCALRRAILVAAPPPAGLLPPPWPTSRVQGSAGGARRRRTRLLAWARCFGMRESRALLRPPPAALGECVRSLFGTANFEQRTPNSELELRTRSGSGDPRRVCVRAQCSEQ